MDRWVSIKDEQPKMYERVLVSTLNVDCEPYVTTAHWNGDKMGFLVTGGIKDKDVTHWQHCPEPFTNK